MEPLAGESPSLGTPIECRGLVLVRNDHWQDLVTATIASLDTRLRCERERGYRETDVQKKQETK